MIFGFVVPEARLRHDAKHRGIWPVAFLCEALGVSRSGFYAWLTRRPSARSRRDEVLSAKIRSSFQDSDRTYGARRVWHDLLAAGIECGLHAIERLMRRNGLRARPRRRRLPIDLGDRSAAALSANVLDRSFEAPAPNRKWVADFTYIWTGEGWLYVAAVLNLFSRRVVGWSMSAAMTAEICITRHPMGGGGWVATHDDVTEQRRSEAKIAHMALHDALTGLPNRALLNERLDHALTRTKHGDIVAAHILDLDHFKHVNDSLGHPVGDKLLQMVGDRLQALVRDSDTIARMGGDEFAIVQVGLSQVADATVLAQRVITAISTPYDIDGHQVVTGTSVGIAVAPTDGTSPDQLIKNADLALYRAKGDGRGTLRFFESSMDAQMQARRVLEHDLRKALTTGEFELHYQPVINLASDKISGCEALIRWHHPERGLVSPATFIPLAEETGLIVQIGEWVIRQACTTAARWPADLKIAVNLSPAQLRSAGLLQVVVSALAASGLAPDRLELEITETVLLEDSEATLAILYRLRELGVHIAMDDFGTGYSSLSYLQSFPFNRIKIDRSFIKDMTEGVGSRNIVRAVVALANGLGMETTAEGVETQEQLDAIRTEGCAQMQGFLFSKPVPAHEVERLLWANTRETEVQDSSVAA